MATAKGRIAAVVRAADANDAAWNEVVTRFTGQVQEAIRSSGLPEQAHERAAKAVWSSLAKRLVTQGAPEDVGQWLVDRARTECRRLTAELGDGARLPSPGRPASWSGYGLPERRRLFERRGDGRPGTERRTTGTGGNAAWSPDALAARLLHVDPAADSGPTASSFERRDSHNTAVDAELAARGLCAAVHLPTGRRCTRPVHHRGTCAFRPGADPSSLRRDLGRLGCVLGR